MKSLIICSGGLDSVSMALQENERGYEIGLITFNYGQKATNEIKVVEELASILNAEHKVMDISPLSLIFGHTQLTDENVKVEKGYKGSVVVPLRNSLFIQIAYIYAMTNGYDRLVLGSHMDDIKKDENGDLMFPDCAPDFFKQLNSALIKGCRADDKRVEIVSASTLGHGKSYLIRKAKELNEEILYKTWSCYKNDGEQCGVCDSCKNRRASFKNAGVEDLTIYQQ